jgi:hypothetical protein
MFLCGCLEMCHCVSWSLACKTSKQIKLIEVVTFLCPYVCIFQFKIQWTDFKNSDTKIMRLDYTPDSCFTNGKILEIERGSTRSHPVENSLWKRLQNVCFSAIFPDVFGYINMLGFVLRWG